MAATRGVENGVLTGLVMFGLMGSAIGLVCGDLNRKGRTVLHQHYPNTLPRC